MGKLSQVFNKVYRMLFYFRFLKQDSGAALGIPSLRVFQEGKAQPTRILCRSRDSPNS
jgi:hypothetical protein